ncbi:MAG: response regulator [Lachnospiraceae bacterium]|nr:response regulator [Lachnospiraceae bacterium]
MQQKIVMVVDDTPSNLQQAMEVLQDKYKVMPVKSGVAALAALDKFVPDLILLDIEMPEMDGFETLRNIKSREELEKVPVIFLTSHADKENEIKGFNCGAVDFIMKPFVPEIMLVRIATQIQLSSLLNSFEEEVRKKTKENNELTFQAINAIAKTVDAKDKYTRQHSTRVAKFSREIAIRSGLFNEEQIEVIYRTALLHDIGKIGIKDAILNKPGRLDDDEFAAMKTHTTIGAEILKDVTLIKDVDKGAKYHHERYDGKGYPQGLKGEEIPIVARIVGVADAYDAMTSDRAYRKHLPEEVVRGELEKGRGAQFDPVFCDIMLQIMDDKIEFPDEETLDIDIK